jgi:hypothetical protein
MSKLKPFIFPFLLLFCNLLLRFLLISKGPYHVDCLQLAIQAEETLKTGQLHYEFGPGYPLTVLLGAFFIWFAHLFAISDAVIAVNSMSVVFSSLSIVMLFLIIRRIINAQAAFFGALLFSVSPLFLDVSTYGKNHAPSIFFLLWGISLLLLYQRSLSLKHLALSGLMIGLMGAARLQDMALMVIPLSVLFFFGTQPPDQQRKRSDLMSSFFAYWSIIFIIAIGFHLPLIFNRFQHEYLSQLTSFANLGMADNFRGFLSASLGQSFIYFLLDMTAFNFALAIFGLYLLWKDNCRLAAFLTAWLLIPLTFYGNLYTTASRFLIISTIPLYIAFSYLYEKLVNFRNKFIKNLSILLFPITCFISLTVIIPNLALRHQYALLPDYARWVGTISEPDSFIISQDFNPFINYYAKRKTLDLPIGRASIKEEDLIVFKNKIDYLLERGVSVYINRTGLNSYNPDRQFSGFMNTHYRLSFLGEHLCEDWHQGGLFLRVGREALFKIERK